MWIVEYYVTFFLLMQICNTKEGGFNSGQTVNLPNYFFNQGLCTRF